MNKQFFETYGMNLVEDMDLFLSYIEDKNPVLTERALELPMKDCFMLNEQLNYKIEIEKPTKRMNRYPYIMFLYQLVIDSELYQVVYDDKSKRRLKESILVDSYKLLPSYVKYIFLLATYWIKGNFEQLSSVEAKHYLVGMKKISEAKQTDISVFNEQIIENYQAGRYPSFNVFLYFGLCRLEVEKTAGFMPTPLGIEISKVMMEDGLDEWNYELANLVIRNLDLCCESDTYLEDALCRIFPPFEEEFSLFLEESDEELLELQNKTYQIKITLRRGVWVVIKINPYHTLHDLHKTIVTNFYLDDDHCYAFNLSPNPKQRTDVYSGYPFGGETTEIQMGTLQLNKGQVFTYVHDFGMETRFNLVIEELLPLETNLMKTETILSKGL